MIAAYRKLYDASRGVTRAEVTSASGLTGENLAALKDQLKAVSGGREVDLDVKIDHLPPLACRVPRAFRTRVVCAAAQRRMSISGLIKEALVAYLGGVDTGVNTSPVSLADQRSEAILAKARDRAALF